MESDEWYPQRKYEHETSQYIPAAFFTLFVKSPNASEYFLASATQSGCLGISCSALMIAINISLTVSDFFERHGVMFFVKRKPWIAMFQGTKNFGMAKSAFLKRKEAKEPLLTSTGFLRGAACTNRKLQWTANPKIQKYRTKVLTSAG
jgi:hypothetical protein